MVAARNLKAREVSMMVVAVDGGVKDELQTIRSASGSHPLARVNAQSSKPAQEGGPWNEVAE